MVFTLNYAFVDKIHFCSPKLLINKKMLEAYPMLCFHSERIRTLLDNCTLHSRLSTARIHSVNCTQPHDLSLRVCQTKNQQLSNQNNCSKKLFSNQFRNQ